MDLLTDAQVLLLAAQLTATPDIPNLRALAARRQDVLTTSLVYRVLLTYLPLDPGTGIEQDLIVLLEDQESAFENFSILDDSLGHEETDIPVPAEAEEALLDLRLEKLSAYRDIGEADDSLSDFVIAWIHKLEEFSGIPPSAIELVEHFSDRHPVLAAWFATYLRPLHKLQNQYYVDHDASLSLHDLETKQGIACVALLLDPSRTSGNSESIGRDLHEIVSPWVRGSRRHKRRKLVTPSPGEEVAFAASWSDVNTWLLNVSHNDYDLATAAAEQWNGPSDAPEDSTKQDVSSEDRISYIRAILAIIYVSNTTDDNAKIRVKKRLLQRAAGLAQLWSPDIDATTPDIQGPVNLQGAVRADLFDNALLQSQNQLTRPSSDVIDFLYGVLSTQSLLSKLKIDSTTRSIASTTLFDSEDKQKQELRAVLNQIPRLTRPNVRFAEARQQILWLQSWSQTASEGQPPSSVAYLGRLTRHYLELQILESMLNSNEFDAIQQIYMSPDNPPLPAGIVKQSILSAIHASYDNASNGNRTRGGVKKASDLLKAFQSSFPDAQDFSHLEYLIRATHSLSFYTLTLQHGIPFQPVSIRISSDPLSLIGKVLEQNLKAYTKLDDLLSIARNLVLAGLPIPSTNQEYAPGELAPIDRRLFDAEHRITYLAITAALADNDFDTAYSLITTRLTTTLTSDSPAFLADDTSWRAAFAAGKHRPSPLSTPNLHDRITALQKRLDLLSTALTLAPVPDPLPEILAAWQELEAELDRLKIQALAEERAADAEAEGALPGGFGASDAELDRDETKRMLESRRGYNASNNTTAGPSYEEETPTGLFDLARSAASALGRNAFPLRGAQGQNVNVKDSQASSRPRSPAWGQDNMEGSMRSSGEFGERPGSAEGQRVRKRDMLSNAVTGGLVSGMSWVLGAQPANNQATQGREHG